MQRLGKNVGGYRGECIDIGRVLEEIKAEATKHGWVRDCFRTIAGEELSAYHRKGSAGERRLYLSTGIHGDEPAGPLAVRELIRENHWPNHIDVWLCPCLNLTGFPLNTRENALGIDLNRDYRHLQAPEVRAHTEWLQQQPSFDLAVCLHEDWEANGFYLYELNPDNRPSLAEKIIKEVSLLCPIEPGPTVDGWDIADGIVRPNIAPKDRAQWPESLFLITSKTRQSYTLESPSDFPIATRIRAHVTAVRTILNSL